MASQSTPAPPLDVVATLQLAFRLWWREFAPITALGFALVTLPEIVGHALAPWTERAGAATVVITLQGALGMLFAASVSFGTLASMSGRALEARTFIIAGLSAAQPGVVAGLTLAAGLVTILILMQISPALGGAGTLLAVGAVGLAFWGFAALVPTVPAAVAERLTPLAALERAARLTRGNRWRLLGMAMIIGLIAMVIGGSLGLLLFGPGVKPETVARVSQAWTFADPAMWIDLLSDLLIAGLLACVPPAVYASLAMRRRKDQPGG